MSDLAKRCPRLRFLRTHQLRSKIAPSKTSFTTSRGAFWTFSQIEMLLSSDPRATMHDAFPRATAFPEGWKIRGLKAWKSKSWSVQLSMSKSEERKEERTNSDLDGVLMSDETDVLFPLVSLDDSGSKDGVVHGVGGSDEGSVWRPTTEGTGGRSQLERKQRREHGGKTNLNRRKKVDPGELLKGSVTVLARLQSVVLQILTDLSSD